MKYFHIILRGYMFTNTPLPSLIIGMSYVVLAGCITYPVAQEKKEIVPVEKIVQAKPESSEQNASKAVELLNQAAKANPASKEPWLELAQLHFEAGDYGKAITAANEVVRRDANDKHAYSILTVAGLRVSIASLSKLPGEGDKLADSVKTETETLVRSLRESLGQTASVTQSALPALPSNKPASHKSKKWHAVIPVGNAGTGTDTAIKSKGQRTDNEPSPRVGSVDPFQVLK